MFSSVVSVCVWKWHFDDVKYDQWCQSDFFVKTKIKPESQRSRDNALKFALCLTYSRPIPILPFLPRDASAERGDATVSRPSVCPFVRDV